MLKINFLGDSVTEGALAINYCDSYVPYIEKKLKCVCFNYGISGTTIARYTDSPTCRSDLDMVSRVDKMHKDVDFVFVAGGINDYWHGLAPFGNMGDEVTTTYCGAVNLLCKRLIERYGKDKVAFILPLPRADERNIKLNETQTLGDYRDVIIKHCKLYDLPYIDLRKTFINVRENSPDSFHPSTKGHEILANEVIKFLNKRFSIGE